MKRRRGERNFDAPPSDDEAEGVRASKKTGRHKQRKEKKTEEKTSNRVVVHSRLELDLRFKKATKSVKVLRV